MHIDSHATLELETVEHEVFILESREWVPNNHKLPVVIYRGATARAEERARRGRRSEDPALPERVEALFRRNAWPPQWRNGIFDYHHFHSTAHEVLGVVSGSADVILGGPGGRVAHVETGDVMLLPAGTGHCLESFNGAFQVVAGYPAGQQWDLRRDALTNQEYEAMLRLPFPASDPVHGAQGPVIEYWVPAA